MTAAFDWLVALVPVLVLLDLFDWLDVFRLMSLPELLVLLLLGALASALVYPVSGRLLDALPMGFSAYSRYAAPWIEEAAKGLAIVALFVANRIGYKVDAAISGFAIGAGFSVVENMLYLTHFGGLGVGVWLVRGLGTAVMHGGTVAIFATLAHHLGERATRARAGLWHLRPIHFLPGYLVAVALHTGFNALPDRPLVAMLLSATIVPGALVAIFALGTTEARGWLACEVTQHRADLAALAAGTLPDSESGRLVAAFLARAGDPALPALVLDHWRLHTEIVLRAEERLLARARGRAVDPDAAADRARMVRLAEIEAILGRARLATLRPLLPFSRNDLWEVREFRQALRRAGQTSRGTTAPPA